MKRCGFSLAIGAMILAGGVWFVMAEEDKPKPVAKAKETVRQFMRKKLAATQDILEGLTTEDFEMIGRGAKLLKTMSEHADFQVSKETMYRQHAAEFERISGKLEKAATDLKLDSAALQYVNLTMNCIECHKFVRNVLVADRPLPGDSDLFAELRTRK